MNQSFPRFLVPRSSMAWASVVVSLALLPGCADGDRADQAVVDPGSAASAEVNLKKPAETPSSRPVENPAVSQAQPEQPKPDEPKPDEPSEPKVYTYEVIAKYPHDRGAYTQGLLWLDGKLYESTGQRGESTIRLVELETGKVIRKRDVGVRYFGEGLAAANGVFYQLTWTGRKAFLYDVKSLRPLSYDYAYTGEGWGLTTAEEGLVMSNGSDTIRFLDPKGMKFIREIKVRDRGRAIDQLNELEWIDGEIWANIWKSDFIARIDPATGKVNSWVDMSGLLGSERVDDPGEEVLNGIAYDKVGKRLFLTGKRWPYLYHVELREQ